MLDPACQITRYNLTAPGAICILALSCNDRQPGVSGGQADIYSWSELHGMNFIFFHCFWRDNQLWLCVAKLCVCKAASPWSQSSLPDSQCAVWLCLKKCSESKVLVVLLQLGAKDLTVRPQTLRISVSAVCRIVQVFLWFSNPK